MTKDDQSARNAYWKDYYAGRLKETVREVPSQFSAFVAQEVPKDFVIFDVGCGSARDSLFFNLFGFGVIGVDGCSTAIRLASEKAERLGQTGITFLESLITNQEIYEAIGKQEETNVCVYARFFLHAINQEEQDFFFENLSKSLKSGDMLAFEYRNNEDEGIEKIANPHYRRYQSEDDVNAALSKLGFEKLYSIVGKGFAKYKTEDASVSRSIFVKS